eukprot:gene10877-16736_t
MLSGAALDERVAQLRSEIGRYGLSNDAEAARMLEDCERKMSCLEQFEAKLQRRQPSPLWRPVDTIVPAAPAINPEEDRRLAELRDESERRIKQAEREIEINELHLARDKARFHGIPPPTTPDGRLPTPAHPSMAHALALRQQEQAALVDASLRLIHDVSPPVVRNTHTRLSPTRSHASQAAAAAQQWPVFPVPGSPRHLLPPGGAQGLHAYRPPSLSPFSNGRSLSPTYFPGKPLGGVMAARPHCDPSMEAAVNTRVQELMTRARLKMKSGIDLPTASPMLNRDPYSIGAPSYGYRQPVSPARLSRPLTAVIPLRSPEVMLSDYRAQEGLLEVMQRDKARREGTLEKKDDAADHVSEPDDPGEDEQTTANTVAADADAAAVSAARRPSETSVRSDGTQRTEKSRKSNKPDPSVQPEAPAEKPAAFSFPGKPQSANKSQPPSNPPSVSGNLKVGAGPPPAVPQQRQQAAQGELEGDDAKSCFSTASNNNNNSNRGRAPGAVGRQASAAGSLVGSVSGDTGKDALSRKGSAQSKGGPLSSAGGGGGAGPRGGSTPRPDAFEPEEDDVVSRHSSRPASEKPLARDGT